MITLTIDHELQSLNVWERYNRHKRVRVKEGLMLQLISAANHAGIGHHTPSNFLTHVAIRSYRARLLDQDNLEASKKPLLDAIVRAGLAFDDGPRSMHSTISQTVNAAHRRTEVDLEWEDRR